MTAYVVRAVNDQGKEQFWATDANSGGYPYWAGGLYAADVFQTREEAERVIEDDLLTKNIVMSDGTIYPPVMVHSGIGLCTKKFEGYMTIGVYAVEFVAVKDTIQTINASLDMGHDIDVVKKNALNKLTLKEREALGL